MPRRRQRQITNAASRIAHAHRAGADRGERGHGEGTSAGPAATAPGKRGASARAASPASSRAQPDHRRPRAADERELGHLARGGERLVDRRAQRAGGVLEVVVDELRRERPGGERLLDLAPPPGEVFGRAGQAEAVGLGVDVGRGQALRDGGTIT